MNRPFLVLTSFFLIFILGNIQSFLDNVWFYSSGSVSQLVIKDQWWFTGLNILVFLSLLLFLGRRNINWKTHGMFSAFVVSLFVEMYGAALLVYFLSNNTADGPQVAEHSIFFVLNFFGIRLGFDLWMTFGSVVIITGITIIALGWYQLWSCKKTLFTDGLYKYSRHPQYIGFLYTIIGWMIAWPTITTLVFTPVLTVAYLYAARKEEERMLEENKEYAAYREKTPFLL